MGCVCNQDICVNALTARSVINPGGAWIAPFSYNTLYNLKTVNRWAPNSGLMKHWSANLLGKNNLYWFMTLLQLDLFQNYCRLIQHLEKHIQLWTVYACALTRTRKSCQRVKLAKRMREQTAKSKTPTYSQSCQYVCLHWGDTPGWKCMPMLWNSQVPNATSAMIPACNHHVPPNWFCKRITNVLNRRNT